MKSNSFVVLVEIRGLRERWGFDQRNTVKQCQKQGPDLGLLAHIDQCALSQHPSLTISYFSNSQSLDLTPKLPSH